MKSSAKAGEYQMLIENIYANDITNLNLEVNPNYNIILNKQICNDSYEFDGITYLENTNITKTLHHFMDVIVKFEFRIC